MCVPWCLDTLHRRLSRRQFVTGAAAGAAVGAAGALAPAGRAAAATTSFGEVVDMSHTLDEDFPTFFEEPGIRMVPMQWLDTGSNMYRWQIIEHAGTHFDAPIHFAAHGLSSDRVDANDLVVPLVVIDIKQRAAENPDTRVTPDDIKAWEAVHGPVPERAAVAMNSGWDRRVTHGRFTNADDEGTFHFPGFHPDTARYLIEETSARGLVVDTLSLDYGPSTDVETHYAWLPANRWGVECVRNLDKVPASGATLVVGAPKVRGATGGLTRVLALV